MEQNRYDTDENINLIGDAKTNIAIDPELLKNHQYGVSTSSSCDVIVCRKCGVAHLKGHKCLCDDTGNLADAPYYREHPIEVIDMMEKIWGRENTSLFCEMNAFKYRMRVGLKSDDTAKDLAKEKWYLDKARQLKE
jgi:hypothetical protein